MKNWIRKIWDKIVAFFCSIPFDKWLHFFAGVIIAAFCCITLKIQWPWFVAMIAGGIKEGFDYGTTGQADWKDFVATTLGGLLIQLFAVLPNIF